MKGRDGGAMLSIILSVDLSNAMRYKMMTQKSAAIKLSLDMTDIDPHARFGKEMC